MAANRITYWTLGLMSAAALINGLLAGGNVDRALVAMPAWRHVGPVGWAEFSKSADLGNGQLLYPVMAISGTIVTIIAAVLFLRENNSPRHTGWPLFLAAALMLAALPFSLKATPFMLSLRHINSEDVIALGRAFSGFEFWGRLQGVFHIAGFCANIWSLVAFGQRTGTVQ